MKPKKKKGHSQIPLSNNAASGGGSVGNQGENTGRWTAEEHRLFLQGLEQHGKGWKKIASLIKSRTVVQIRTHAQKYFQKLAKARQNGEDEGAVTFMEGRGGTASTTSASTIIPRRRRQVTGTKRKAIQSVVASVQRQGKKIATAASAHSSAISIAPALKFFVIPSSSTITDTSDETLEGIPSGPALEDSLYVALLFVICDCIICRVMLIIYLTIFITPFFSSFRFLTPCPPGDTTTTQSINRQLGSNHITLPSDNLNSPAFADGEISPTGVNDISIYPLSWTDAKEPPSWYTKGEDVDALLDVADSLDWLADTGDLDETYVAPPMEESTDNSLSVMDDDVDESYEKHETSFVYRCSSANNLILPRVDSSLETMTPALPSFFHSQNETSYTNLLSHAGEGHISTGDFKSLPSGLLDAQLQVFDTPMEEHAFVSTILEDDDDHHEGESNDCLPLSFKIM